MASYPSSHKEWLSKLISFDTTSCHSNLQLVKYVEAFLTSLGVSSTLVYNPEKTKASLFSTLRAEDGSTQGGLILSGHTDVVPVQGQTWDTDPFVMVEKDAKLYGRGACDMKGFLAVVLSLTPQFLSLRRAKPIHYAFSFDEEVGCIGARLLTSYLKEKDFKADGCLIGEPTGMQVYTGNKGISRWVVRVNGKAAHSSMALMNTSCNAIEYAAQLVEEVRRIAEDVKQHGVRDECYTCPFPCISTGLVKGGNGVNTVPAECEFVFSVRVTDEHTAAAVEDRLSQYIQKDVLPAMRKEYAEATVEVVPGACYPAFNANEADRLTQHARHLCKDYEIHKMGGGTEAGYYQGVLGVPTVIVGPGLIDVAHCPNEYVTISQMDQSATFTLEMVRLYTVVAFESKR